jgi:hypothetical protein
MLLFFSSNFRAITPAMAARVTETNKPIFLKHEYFVFRTSLKWVKISTFQRFFMFADMSRRHWAFTPPVVGRFKHQTVGRISIRSSTTIHQYYR